MLDLENSQAQHHALTGVSPAGLGWQGINDGPDGTAGTTEGDSTDSSGAGFPASRRLQAEPAPAGTAKVQLYTQFVKMLPDIQQTDDRTGM